jgi:SOS-response transcriptional repressor LexA
MEKPSDRLRRAIRELGYEGPTEAWAANKRQLGFSKDLVISNANGNRDISKRAAERYAAVFGHSPGWYLYPDKVAADDVVEPTEMRTRAILDVPRVSWITAGELGDQQAVVDFSEFPTVQAADLPAGSYIALKLEPGANSMNKISPPESTIFVNLDDRRLVPNGCYVIADEQGRATYKRYRPGDDPVFQPASYEDVDPPKLEGAITVIGRVRRSMIDM